MDLDFTDLVPASAGQAGNLGFDDLVPTRLPMALRDENTDIGAAVRARTAELAAVDDYGRGMPQASPQASPQPTARGVPSTISLRPGEAAQPLDMRAPPAPEPGQSRTSAALNAFPRGAVQATGQAISGAAEALAGPSPVEVMRGKLTVLEAIAAGKVLPSQQDPDNLQSMHPDDRAALAASLRSGIERGYRPPGSRVTQAVSDAGQAVSDFGGRQFPVAPEREGDSAVKVAGGLGTFVPMVATMAGATALGQPQLGVGAAALMAGGQAYDGTYKRALEENPDRPDMAHDAASLSGLVGMGAMTVPVARWVTAAQRMTGAPLAQTALRLAAEGTIFTGIAEAQKTLDNAIARQTYAPGRPLTDGLGHDLAETFLTGALAPVAMHAPSAARAGLRALRAPDAAPEFRLGAAGITEAAERVNERAVSFDDLTPRTEQNQSVIPDAETRVQSDPTIPDETVVSVSAPIIGRGFQGKAGGVVSRLMADLNLTREQAAGVVGNLGHESGLEAISERNPTVPGSRGGFGWAQWTGPRRDAFEAYARERGMTVTDPEANYGFLVHELRGPESKALDALRGADTVEAATRAFEAGYERAGIKAIDSRIKLAREAHGAKPAIERPAANGTEPVYTNSGTRIDVRPEIVELASLVASHDQDGRVNPAFPHEEGMQPRDRSSAASQAQIQSIASGLQPERLNISRDAGNGAPIVSPAGVVESGNGRTLALHRVYTDPALQRQAESYREFLSREGYDVAGMQQPVLVARRTTAMDGGEQRAFARDANERSTLSMSQSEQARADASRVEAALPMWQGNSAGDAGNREFVRTFMARLPAEESGTMMLKDGSLSPEGERRINGAVTAAAYGDAMGSTLDKALNGNSDGVRAIAGGLTDAAGAWSVMRAAVKDKTIPASMDVTQALGEAVQTIERARQLGRPVSELVGQSDLTRASASPETQALLGMMFNDAAMTKPAGRARVADRLRTYADEAMKAAPGPDMFGGEPAKPHEVIAASLRRLAKRDDPKTMLARRDAEQAHRATERDADVADLTPTAVAARDRLRTAAQAMMRFMGIPAEVGLKLVDRIVAGAHGADGSYTKGLITMAMDTRPQDMARKVFHEIVHPLMDPALGILTAGQRKTLLDGADAWMRKNPAERQKIEALYGTDKALVREEAVARMGEEAFDAGLLNARPAERVYERLLNAMDGIGRLLRGQGYGTAEDVFRAVLRGDKAQAGSREALAAAGPQDALRGAAALAGAPMAAYVQRGPEANENVRGGVEPATAPERAPEQASNADPVAAGIERYGKVPDRYLSRREAPLLSDKARLERAGQSVLPGAEASDREAIKARQNIGPRSGQKSLDGLPLFGSNHKQASLFSLRQNLTTAVRDGTEAPRQAVTAALNQALFPMRQGSNVAQRAAFNFANALRGIQYRYGVIDQQLVRQFKPEDRAAMGRALDAQSVFDQSKPDAAARAAFDAGKTGLAGLNAKQRATVETLNRMSQQTWQRLQKRKIVMPNADGLPYYMPRQFVMLDGLAGTRRIAPEDNQLGAPGKGGGGLTAMDPKGTNLSDRGPQKRENLTPEESLAGATAKFGENVALVTDIRSLVDALSRQERAIAGRDLVNAIKRLGDEHGVDMVREGVLPAAGYFTLDHPSLWTVGLTGADGPDGKAIYGRMPLHIAEEFRGPLNAVLNTKQPDWYRAIQAIKAKSMGAIMFSPLMHLMVEVGRSLPLYHGNPVAMGRSMLRGRRMTQDRDFMDQAIKDGLAPIGRNWKSFDPVSVMNDAQDFGPKTWTQKILGGDTVVQRVYHETHAKMLWDQVFNLQTGIYTDMRARYMEKGFTPGAAGIMAAHLANRYAGALPPEHLSKLANMAANMTLFSRSFTLGNIGVMKDMLNGAPSHIRAALEAELTPEMMAKATTALKMQARHAFALDIALFYGINAVAQSVFVAAGKSDNLADFPAAMANEWLGYARDMTLPQFRNEPGKTDRIYAGQDSGGRGTYVRTPLGKVGEEFLGWMPFIGHPGQMIMNKLNPLLRATTESVIGKDSLGRAIYNPHPDSIKDNIEKARDIAFHFAKTMLPVEYVGNLTDVVTGRQTGDRLVGVARVAGPVTGLASISQGNAKGPEGGVQQSEVDKQRFRTNRAFPEAKRLYAAGKEAEARAVLEQAYGDPRQANSAMRSIMNPARAQVRLNRNFNRSAPEEEKQRASSVTGGRGGAVGIAAFAP